MTDAASVRLGTVLRGRDNNLNLLRMLAALAVLVTHSFALCAGTSAAEPFQTALGMTLGTIAVDLFFLASGLLVTASLVNGRSLLAFTCARVLRIYPALVVMLLLLVLIVGPAMSMLDTWRYLRDPATAAYFLRNAVLFFGVHYQLPGVWLDNPYPAAVNGSLWTMPYEVRAYACLVAAWCIAGLLPGGQRRCLTGIALAVVPMLGLAVLGQHAGVLHLPHGVRLSFMFATGAALFLMADRVVLSRGLAVALLLALAGLAGRGHSALFGALYLVTVAYLTLCLAYLPGGWIRRYNRLGDYSYGVYIYAFPVQQTVIALWPGIAPGATTAAAAAVTLGLAAASWHLVEKPALGARGALADRVRRGARALRRAGFSRPG